MELTCLTVWAPRYEVARGAKWEYISESIGDQSIIVPL